MIHHLDRLPQDLEGLFAEILARDISEIRDCVSLLQWVLYAARPLKSSELYLAIQHSFARPDKDEINVPREAILARYLLHNSRGLVELTKSEPPVIQFIHETVREFLVGKSGLCRVDLALEVNLLGWSHAKLAQTCLCYFSRNYLSVAKSRHGSNGQLLLLPSQLEQLSKQTIETELPFMEYAISSFFAHAESAQRYGIPQLACLNLLRTVDYRLNRYWISFRNVFEKFIVRRYDERVTTLYAVVDQKLPHLTRILADEHAMINSNCGRHGNALKAACHGGSEEIVQCLLNHGADVNAIGGEHKHALLTATAAKQFHIVLLLLSLDIPWEINLLNKVFCKSTEQKSVQRLLEMGVDVNCVGNRLGGTALHAAASRGDADIVSLLLKEGANINLKDIFSETALYKAVQVRKIEVIKILWAQGADTNAKNAYSHSPLAMAVVNANHEAKKQLLGTPSISFKAPMHDQLRLVKLLLEFGANPDDLRHYPVVFLFIAAIYLRHFELCKIFINAGVKLPDDSCYGRLFPEEFCKGLEDLIDFLASSDGSHHIKKLRSLQSRLST